jgi:hypothetical protein
MTQKVSKALENPVVNRLEIQSLAYDLCNYSMNINCSSCIQEAVMLLSNWLKEKGIANDFFKRAAHGEYNLKSINLFVQVYKSDNEARQKELDECLRINKSLNIKGMPYFNVIEIKERLTFSEMFDLTKSYKDNINIISNSDIFFDETVLLSRFMGENDCYALSRWDYLPNKFCNLFNRKDSQDVWIFNGAVNCNGGKYNLGIPGCDNKVAFELNQSGYNVLNPSKSIHAIHFHNTQHRTYTPAMRLVEPFHFIYPHH